MKSLAEQYGVCDLKYAIELKELGYKQTGFLRWAHICGSQRLYLRVNDNAYSDRSYIIAPLDIDSEIETFKVIAPTVAELGEALPIDVYCMRTRELGELFWKAQYISGYVRIDADTEANARAKMLIYLIKKGIVKL